MMYYMYGWKSKMNNSFARPMFELEDPTITTTLIKRQVPNMKLDDINKFKDMDFYLLGTFDDETGLFTSQIQMLIGFDSFMSIIRQKELELKLAGMEAKDDEQIQTVE